MSTTDRVHLDQKGRLVIGDHAEVVRLAHDPETFSSIVSRHLQVPNGLDGAAHAEMRHLLDPFMDADAVAQLLPELERIAADLVARLDAADAPFGAVADLGARFAVRAQSAWLGWLTEWEEPLLQWVADNRVASRTGHPRATATTRNLSGSLARRPDDSARNLSWSRRRFLMNWRRHRGFEHLRTKAMNFSAK